jgi:hypothetical protein
VSKLKRTNKRARIKREQALFEGSKSGLIASLLNEPKYTNVENHVIRAKDGATVIGGQLFLNRLMEHCRQINSTTDTHPMKPGEIVEGRKEWIHCAELKEVWAEQQRHKEANR